MFDRLIFGGIVGLGATFIPCAYFAITNAPHGSPQFGLFAAFYLVGSAVGYRICPWRDPASGG